MKARELISSASYETDAKDRLGSIAATFGDNPLAFQAAGVKLANIILSVPHHQQSNAVQIKNSALQLMALNYRAGSISG